MCTLRSGTADVYRSPPVQAAVGWPLAGREVVPEHRGSSEPGMGPGAGPLAADLLSPIMMEPELGRGKASSRAWERLGDAEEVQGNRKPGSLEDHLRHESMALHCPPPGPFRADGDLTRTLPGRQEGQHPSPRARGEIHPTRSVRITLSHAANREPPSRDLNRRNTVPTLYPAAMWNSNDGPFCTEEGMMDPSESVQEEQDASLELLMSRLRLYRAQRQMAAMHCAKFVQSLCKAMGEASEGSDHEQTTARRARPHTRVTWKDEPGNEAQDKPRAVRSLVPCFSTETPRPRPGHRSSRRRNSAPAERRLHGDPFVTG